MIQIRNLNIDPDAFAEIMPPFTKAIGTKEFIRQLHEEFLISSLVISVIIKKENKSWSSILE